MKCLHCGTVFADGMTSCPNCGAPAAPYGQPNPQPYMQGQPGPQPYMQGQPGPQPYMQGQPYPGGMGYAPQRMTKKEFLRHPNLKSCAGKIVGAAVFAYISGVITFAYSLFFLDSGIFSIVDLLLPIGLGLGIQLGQSRVCAIILLISGALSVISGIVEDGRLQGYLLLIVAINAVIATFRFHKAWKEYQNSGIVPVLKY